MAGVYIPMERSSGPGALCSAINDEFTNMGSLRCAFCRKKPDALNLRWLFSLFPTVKGTCPSRKHKNDCTQPNRFDYAQPRDASLHSAMHTLISDKQKNKAARPSKAGASCEKFFTLPSLPSHKTGMVDVGLAAAVLWWYWRNRWALSKAFPSLQWTACPSLG